MKVRDLFDLNAEVFKEFRLLTGVGGLGNEITDVVIMEVPDGIYWINPDNFVITTGYSLMTNEVSIENMIQLLISRKAAALGIKIGKYIDSLPEKIIAYANEHNFPIISIASINMNDIACVSVNDLLLDFMSIRRFRSSSSSSLSSNDSFDEKQRRKDPNPKNIRSRTSITVLSSIPVKKEVIKLIRDNNMQENPK